MRCNATGVFHGFSTISRPASELRPAFAFRIGNGPQRIPTGVLTIVGACTTVGCQRRMTIEEGHGHPKAVCHLQVLLGGIVHSIGTGLYFRATRGGEVFRITQPANVGSLPTGIPSKGGSRLVPPASSSSPLSPMMLAGMVSRKRMRHGFSTSSTISMSLLLASR